MAPSLLNLASGTLASGGNAGEDSLSAPHEIQFSLFLHLIEGCTRSLTCSGPLLVLDPSAILFRATNGFLAGKQQTALADEMMCCADAASGCGEGACLV